MEEMLTGGQTDARAEAPQWLEAHGAVHLPLRRRRVPRRSLERTPTARAWRRGGRSGRSSGGGGGVGRVASACFGSFVRGDEISLEIGFEIGFEIRVIMRVEMITQIATDIATEIAHLAHHPAEMTRTLVQMRIEALGRVVRPRVARRCEAPLVVIVVAAHRCGRGRVWVRRVGLAREAHTWSMALRPGTWWSGLLPMLPSLLVVQLLDLLLRSIRLVLQVLRPALLRLLRRRLLLLVLLVLLVLPVLPVLLLVLLVLLLLLVVATAMSFSVLLVQVSISE